MISDRNRRRLANRSMKRQQAAIRAGREPGLAARPEVDEVFRLEDDGTGQPLYFDVRALRAWTKANLETKSLAVEPGRAQRFIESGQVDLDHVMASTIRQQPDPVILCRHAAGPGEDAIVDGAHRYVAAAIGIAMISGRTAGYHAYVLEPEQWRPFVLSPDRLAEIAAANR
ncbi:hypothetical protein D9601_16870 [Sphingomonas sp. MA1305]|jgi:hypothetical protein|uniref:hypothetical protein n=1 Tax=Sphingomonas sp. MA1305 TaxID=2479204 RepID=UPI0018E0228D|nr:hypothetical protein [Sphingomonas sp. MA1305]MBI0477026.1 hypothetical protein [Sphingomonas sp. MA1305]